MRQNLMALSVSFILDVAGAPDPPLFTLNHHVVQFNCDLRKEMCIRVYVDCRTAIIFPPKVHENYLL